MQRSNVRRVLQAPRYCCITVSYHYTMSRVNSDHAFLPRTEPEPASRNTAIPLILDSHTRQECHQQTLTIRREQAPHLGDIIIVELRRPKVKNAISTEMLGELEQLLEELYREAETNAAHALILTSSLPDVFCAGADLAERTSGTLADTRAFLAHARRVFALLENLPIPTIACVSGVALGGGLELALCCHLRVFSTNAKVGLPETRLGVVPGGGGTFRLPVLIGTSNALDLILTGRRVGGAEAARLGLCNRLVEPENDTVDDVEGLRSSTLAAGLLLAREITVGAPLAIKAALRAVAGACESAEDAAYDSVVTSEDRDLALSHVRKKKKTPIVFAGR
jgi:enoyl-CoA hydratase/carnithine racemase